MNQYPTYSPQHSAIGTKLKQFQENIDGLRLSLMTRSTTNSTELSSYPSVAKIAVRFHSIRSYVCHWTVVLHCVPPATVPSPATVQARIRALATVAALARAVMDIWSLFREAAALQFLTCHTYEAKALGMASVADYSFLAVAALHWLWPELLDFRDSVFLVMWHRYSLSTLCM